MSLSSEILKATMCPITWLKTLHNSLKDPGMIKSTLANSYFYWKSSKLFSGMKTINDCKYWLF